MKKKTIVVGSTIGAAFIAAGIVFSMLLVGRIRANDECRVRLEEVSSTRGAIEKFIDTKAQDVKLTDDELKIWEEFEDAYHKAEENYNSARNYELIKKERDEADEQWKRVEKLFEAEQKLKLVTDGELSDEDIVAMKESTVAKIALYANDLGEYRAKVADFKEKYGTVDTSKNDDMRKAYDELIALGNTLTEKYAKMDLADVLEMSRDDILAFYDTIDLLKNKE